jgi:hypothetical protein
MSKRISLIVTLALLLSVCFLPIYSFEKVVIWGHKLGTHTHSYIHQGFYTAFKELGYNTHWFDNADDVREFDFANTLFLTEGQVDKNMPVRNDCIYLLHNTERTRYQELPPTQYINFQVYNDTILDIPNLVKLDTCIYYDLAGRCFYMPWATDLLPNEIEEIKQQLPTIMKEKCVYWIGTIGGGRFGNKTTLAPFIQACEENGIKFTQAGAATRVAGTDSIALTRVSYIAPAIVGEWQKSVGYIPCRIFKNISYGQMGVTNSKRVHELFEGKIVYNPDTHQLFYDAQKRLETTSLEDIYALMDIVKTKHTYLNRVQQLLDFVQLVQATNTRA